MEGKKKSSVGVTLIIILFAIVIVVLSVLLVKTNNEKNEAVQKSTALQTQVNTLNNSLGNLQKNKLQEESSNYQNKINESENKINQTNGLNEETAKANNDVGEYFALYNGTKIPIKIGEITASYIEKVTESNKEKYNITYYNYENGQYVGESKGKLVEGAFDDSALVDNVKKIAMSKKFNATPRTFRKINELPNELMDMADCTTVDIHSIDLDGDGKEEKIVCDTVNYGRGEFGDGEPVAASDIMLFDSNYEKIADLVNLEDGFAEQGQEKHEASKVFLSLDMVDYIDIDNDGIMEIIIDIPMYENDGLSKLSILKYNKGNIEGQTNIKANVRP